MTSFTEKLRGGTGVAAALVLCGALLGSCAQSVQPVTYEKSQREALLNPGPAAIMSEATQDRYKEARTAKEVGNYAKAEAIYTDMAQNGFADAAYELGKMYKFGEGVQQSDEKAAAWFVAAVKSYNDHRPQAAYHLGAMFAEGEGVPKDPVLAVELLRLAERNGITSAAVPMADLYLRGEGVPRDPAHAEMMVRDAAAKGDANAHFWLMQAHGPNGALGSDPQIVQSHAQQVIPILQQKASADQDTTSMRKLAIIYSQGLGVNANHEEAMKWYKRAAAAGEPGLLVNYAEALMNRPGATEQDLAEAVDIVGRVVSTYNHPEAQLLLGQAYMDGRGVKRNPTEGRKWIQMAAQQELPRAQLAYGRILMQESRNPADKQRALAMFRSAHAAGLPYATAELGEMHLRGQFDGADPARGAEMLQQAYDAGVQSAAIKLGRAYLDGEGVERDPQLAKQWLERAASSGNKDAQFALAHAVMEGSIPGDKAAALNTVKQYAENGDGFAMIELARAYRDGAGVPQDYQQAQRWFEQASRAGVKDADASLASMIYMDARDSGEVDMQAAMRAAEMGHPGAMAAVGRANLSGQGLPRDTGLGVDMLQRAAEKGHAGAKAAMGEIYLHGQHGIPKDVAKGRQYLETAAASGHVNSLRVLGQALIEGTDVPADASRGVQMLRQAAAKNDAYAMQLLGNAYLEGKGGLPVDPAKAQTWLTRAAESGDTYSMTRLGEAYLTGDGVDQDVDKGVDFLSRAAERGDDTAQMVLGRAYAHGSDGVEQDLDRGVALLEKGAQQGHAGSMATLGRIYLSDSMGRRDIAKGAEYLYRAARKGHPTARLALAKAYLQSQGIETANAEYADVWLRGVLDGDSELAIRTLTEMLQEGQIQG